MEVLLVLWWVIFVGKNGYLKMVEMKNSKPIVDGREASNMSGM